MSGFTIPNTPDASVSNQNQAEPDSLDFQIIGNQKSGVVSGLAVTPGSGATVAVSSGEILLNGAYHTYSSGTVALTTYTTLPFFDVIVARVSGGVVTCFAVSGSQTTNPRFPSAGTPGSSTVVDLDTEVVLAAVWRTGAGVIPNEIVDKRVFVRSNTSRVGPTPTGGVHADTWTVPTSWTPNLNTLAGPLSVKVGSTWRNLAFCPTEGIPQITVNSSSTPPSPAKQNDIWIRVV
jgi:hypothetical protein